MNFQIAYLKSHWLHLFIFCKSNDKTNNLIGLTLLDLKQFLVDNGDIVQWCFLMVLELEVVLFTTIMFKN